MDWKPFFKNLVVHYTLYILSTHWLNGANSQGENIADNAGIKLSYKTYSEWTENNPKESMLPGFNYTQKQMFWLSAASVWCEVIRPESLKLQVVIDKHAPGEYRVKGPFGNNEDFQKDFNCKQDSKMNREDKCMIW